MKKLGLYLEVVKRRNLDLWLVILLGIIFVSIVQGWSLNPLYIAGKILAYILLMQGVALYVLSVMYVAFFSLAPVLVSLYMGYKEYRIVKRLGRGNPIVAGVKTFVLIFLVLHLFFFIAYHAFDSIFGGMYGNIVETFITQMQQLTK